MKSEIILFSLCFFLSTCAIHKIQEKSAHIDSDSISVGSDTIYSTDTTSALPMPDEWNRENPDYLESSQKKSSAKPKSSKRKTENSERASLTEDTVFATIEEFNVSNLGAIAYSIPDTMKVGVTYKVILRLSKKMSASLSAGLPAITIVREIRVGSTMSAVLKDASPEQNSFRIEPLNSAVQSVENDSSYTTWEWSVMPIKSGSNKLKLVIVIKQGDFVKDIPVYEDDITVFSSPMYSIEKFFNDNWKELGGGLMSSILIPLFVWLYNRKKKKKDEDT